MSWSIMVMFVSMIVNLMSLPHIMVVALYATAQVVLFTASIKPSVLLVFFVAVSLDETFTKMLFRLTKTYTNNILLLEACYYICILIKA